MRSVFALILVACGARSELRDRPELDASVVDVVESDAVDAQVSSDVLVDGQDHPWAIAVDATSVYWTNVIGAPPAAPQLLKCAKTGCSDHPTTLAAGVAMIPVIAVDASAVYWATNFQGHDLLACGLGGCGQQPQTISVLPNVSEGIAAKNGKLSWTTNSYAHGTVNVCTPSSCAATTTILADAQVAAQSIAIDAQNAYWTNTISSAGTIMQCALSGCGDSPLILADGQDGASSIVVDATNVYWMNTSGIWKCAIGGCGKQPIPIYKFGQLGSGGPLAIDGASLYFIGSGGAQPAIVKCPVTGCEGPPEIVAPSPPQMSIHGIAVDETSVYWTAADGFKGGKILKHTPK